jgi:hypothetical protein
MRFAAIAFAATSETPVTLGGCLSIAVEPHGPPDPCTVGGGCGVIVAALPRLFAVSF